MKETNDTMMQYFEWYMPNDCNLWQSLQNVGKDLKKLGINYLCLPPCFKSAGGINDTVFVLNMALSKNTWMQLNICKNVV